jgi:hypothetical protein
MKAWSLVICAGVNGYLLGVMVLFAAVVYPGFGAVDRAAFPAAYQVFTSRIPLSVVLWEFIAGLSVLLLYAWRPDGVPLWAVHALVLLTVGYFAITFGWHLPAHRALAGGDNSAEALKPLLSSQWTRTAVQLARAGILLYLSAGALLRASANAA